MCSSAWSRSSTTRTDISSPWNSVAKCSSVATSWATPATSATVLAIRRAPSALVSASCRISPATPEELFRRLRHDTQRPLLQVADPLRRLRELFRERDPLYRQTAHYVIETGRPSVPALVNMVLMQLELAGLVDPLRVPSTIGAGPATGLA